MNSTKLFFAGYNGFKQFENCDDLMVSNATEWKKNEVVLPSDHTAIKFCSTWSVNILAVERNLYITGFLIGRFGQSETLTFSDDIKMISSNDNICLILLNNGNCYKLTFTTMELVLMNFLGVDEPNSIPSAFRIGKSEEEKKTNVDVIEHIASGHTFSVAVTKYNVVYNIPSRIYAFPNHIKVKKLCCGAEHALLLTTNGDIYSWGSSSRGQLGLGQLENELSPVLIEGLAGIKITDISTGLWHSAAVSVFGDLYMWGWNVNGQMGKPIHKTIKVNFESGRSDVVRHKETSVFASPIVIDLPIQRLDNSDEGNDDNEGELNDQFSIEQVHCGSRHTILVTKCKKILGCGFNTYGQVGISQNNCVDGNIVQFMELHQNLPSILTNVICGRWCTILISKEMSETVK